MSRSGGALRALQVVAAGVALAFGPALGCGLRAKPLGRASGEAGAPAPATAGGAGVFEPVALRLHALTRFTVDPRSGEPVIEAHFEPIDRWSHGVKALGELVFELYRGAPASGGGAAGSQLRVWAVDLRDPETNSEQYDRVTRTYRVLLGDLPPDVSSGEGLALHARFTTESGRRLEAARRFGS